MGLDELLGNAWLAELEGELLDPTLDWCDIAQDDAACSDESIEDWYNFAYEFDTIIRADIEADFNPRLPRKPNILVNPLCPYLYSMPQIFVNYRANTNK